MGRQFKIGDHIRIVNYFLNKYMPVGIVERMDGEYIYISVKVNTNGITDQYRGSYEVYENEIVKITDQEYFKLLLSGVNNDV